MHKILIIYDKNIKRIKHQSFLKYYYKILKLRIDEEKKKQEYKINKLFEDYKRKEEIINQLQQQYLLREGEKYTFFPIINNYIIKYRAPCFFNNTNKYSITEYDKGIQNMNYSLFNGNTRNNSNKTFNVRKEVNSRYNKNKKIKRIKLINHNNNSKKYVIVPKNININNPFNLKSLSNKKSSPNFMKRIKTEESLNKTIKRETTLKSLIQDEKIKNKKINKNMSHNISKKDVNKIIDSIFHIDKTNKNKNLNRIKTESSFLLTRDESNIFSDKKNSNNLRLQTESSTYENINILLKKINQKNNAQKNNDNISNNNSNSKESTNKYIFSKKIDNARNKIVSINICRSNDITDNKYIYKKINNINKIIPITKGKGKIIPLHPYKKITIIKNKPKLKKINFNAILKNLNNNNRYYSNFNKTQINNEETSQTSDKEIYRNISLKIKKEKLIKNNKKFSNELKINDSSKKGDDRMSIQSISDSKVLEIANTYIDDKVDKIEISGILTQKKLQNQNSYYDG